MIFTINEAFAYGCNQLNFLITYSIEFFYFHIYDTDFHARPNDISQVPANNFSLCVLAT